MQGRTGRGKRGGVVAVEMKRARVAALQALLDLGMLRRRRPTVLSTTERRIATALAAGTDVSDILSDFRLAPERLAFICVRILQTERVSVTR